MFPSLYFRFNVQKQKRRIRLVFLKYVFFQYQVKAVTAKYNNEVKANLVLLEVGPDSPTLVIGKRVPVFLEERVDAWNTTIPRIL